LPLVYRSRRFEVQLAGALEMRLKRRHDSLYVDYRVSSRVSYSKARPQFFWILMAPVSQHSRVQYVEFKLLDHGVEVRKFRSSQYDVVAGCGR
jgi:hypothetical protein